MLALSEMRGVAPLEDGSLYSVVFFSRRVNGKRDGICGAISCHPPGILLLDVLLS